jgi:membrane associated rhomboid family serine protease
MANHIIEDIKLSFKNGNPISRLILFNSIVFIVMGLLRIFTFLASKSGISWALETIIFDNLALPLDFQQLLFKPWTLLTYMFTHIELFHIFWNMLSLYWFGQILVSYTSTKKIIPLFLLGGIGGGLLTIILFTVIPAFHSFLGVPLIGASAGVTAIIVAVATLVPTVKINMFLVGPVKLIYIALFVIFIDVLNIASRSNIGGNISHIGGALIGYFFIVQYKRGRDLSLGINRFFTFLGALFTRKPKSKMKVSFKQKVSDEEYNYNKKIDQQKIDNILDKISKSGYESLSKAEKEFLFQASNKP